MAGSRPENVVHHVALDATDEASEVVEARELLASGQIDAAIAVLEPLTQTESDDYLVFEVLGVAYAHKGNMMAAVGALETAARLNPVMPSNHYNLGQALLRAGDVAGAKVAFERALRVDPTYAKAREALGALVTPPPAPPPPPL